MSTKQPKGISEIIKEKLDPHARQEGGSHYKDMGIEPWDVVDTWPIEQQIGAHRLGALKYIMRMGSKDTMLLDVRKAGHFIQKLTQVLDRGDSV